MVLESDYARRVGSYAFKARLLLLTTEIANSTFEYQVCKTCTHI